MHRALLVITLAGCSSAAVVRRVLPSAEQSHVESLRAPTPIVLPIDRSPTATWNAAGEVVSELCGVQAEDADAKTLQSDWCYAAGLSSDRMSTWQTRVRFELSIDRSGSARIQAAGAGA